MLIFGENRAEFTGLGNLHHVDDFLTSIPNLSRTFKVLN